MKANDFTDLKKSKLFLEEASSAIFQRTYNNIYTTLLNLFLLEVFIQLLKINRSFSCE